MADIYDVVGTTEYQDKRTGEKKTRFTKLGVAFPLKSGDGFSLRLDALPVNGTAIIKPKKDRDQGGNDKDIPF